MVIENTTLWATSATHAQGTIRWQAPELFDAEATTASDVYAWAMTCLVSGGYVKIPKTM